MPTEPDSGYERLENQIAWYDSKSIRAQSSYKWLKRAEIVLAALIPVSALIFREDAIVAGVLGAVIVILAGFQELGAYQRNWIKYRSTCEALTHEKFLFLGRTGPYAAGTDADAWKDLVNRVEALVSEENTNWSAHMEALKTGDATDGDTPGPNGQGAAAT